MLILCGEMSYSRLFQVASHPCFRASTNHPRLGLYNREGRTHKGETAQSDRWRWCGRGHVALDQHKHQHQQYVACVGGTAAIGASAAHADCTRTRETVHAHNHCGYR